MRPTTIAVISVLIVSSLAAQTLHQATPVDQLLKEIHARHHQHLVAEMDAMPPKLPDGFNAAAAKAFTISAHQFDFTINPSPFVVNVGDSVTLDITSTDVTHGFFLEHYMTNFVTLPRGVHRTVTFVANTPGIFTYACTESSCGVGHGDMVGDFVVQAAAAAPAISSFNPNSGTTAGGTVVAISGSNFQNGASVNFGDTAAVSVTVNSSSSISAMSPAHAAGDVAITVTNPDGQSATSGNFSYIIPGPTITSITPSTGSTAGGTAITISGTNFVSGATVTIGGVPAINVNIPNSTTINATTPLGPFDIASSAARDVVVTNPDGRSVTRSGGFTYTLPALSIASISPNAGSPSGGTQVVISGAGFTTALAISVMFGGVPGTNIQVASPVTLNVMAPAHATGTVDVVVTVGSAQATSAGGFSFQTPVKKRRAVRLQ